MGGDHARESVCRTRARASRSCTARTWRRWRSRTFPVVGYALASSSRSTPVSCNARLLSVPNVLTPPAVGTVRVLIVDDEPLARDCMRLALKHVTGVAIVAECGDGASAVEAIHRHAPDVVFLDVQMPGLDGFGVLERIDSASMPVVVFVTAFDSHAIRAFEVNALDYVLKPFPDERLVAALDRARTTIQERRHGELGRRLAAFVQDWQAGSFSRRELSGDAVDSTHAG